MSEEQEPHPQRLSWAHFQQLLEVLVRAIEPVARLIDSISRLR
jgi:hypothetical protein